MPPTVQHACRPFRSKPVLQNAQENSFPGEASITCKDANLLVSANYALTYFGALLSKIRIGAGRPPADQYRLLGQKFTPSGLALNFVVSSLSFGSEIAALARRGPARRRSLNVSWRVVQMADDSAIEWTDSTFTYWEGCQHAGPGCDNCYAELRNARFGGGVAHNWGPGAPRRLTSLKNRNRPRRWHRRHADFFPLTGGGSASSVARSRTSLTTPSRQSGRRISSP